ncbi:hypothetical protein KVR01_012291 [Diaporthe batatas]|uniref:uncharacterized protein n=1 Tax=Diaporthe batatas TaxID=748121 RepID=UPI001D037911|nr:uncharacterized protein KVR01_012291 [Diaporthe batatas]KAG8158019.1 hypothetical protein KVR01_012291 [Diaporthe batatas]
MSASSTRSCDQLYAETCVLPQSFTARCSDDMAIEYIQSWLLLSHFELPRVRENQAVLTAGRRCRFVLMARLFEMDRDAAPGAAETMCPCPDVEERRRTFWVAFCPDRLLCSRNQYPLTFQEVMICTRLPAPEANFHNNQPVRVGFLSDTIMFSTPPSPLSPLAECVVMVTIHGWRMIYRGSGSTTTCHATQTPHGCSADTNMDCSCEDSRKARECGRHGFWSRQKWLASTIEKRLQLLGMHNTRVSSAVHDAGGDPMLLSARMLAHGAVIRLGHFLLARQMPSFGYFKVHPYLPDMLGCAATYLMPTRGGNASLCRAVGGGAQKLFQVIRDIPGMNSLARDYLQSSVNDEQMCRQQVGRQEFMGEALRQPLLI